MKLGYLQGTGRNYDLPAFIVERLSGSLEWVEATLCKSKERTRVEAVRAGAIAQRVRLNSV